MSSPRIHKHIRKCADAVRMLEDIADMCPDGDTRARIQGWIRANVQELGCTDVTAKAEIRCAKEPCDLVRYKDKRVIDMVANKIKELSLHDLIVEDFGESVERRHRIFVISPKE